MRARPAAALLLLCAGGTVALDNGFTTPALGWSSWYAAPHGSQVTDAFVRASAEALVSSGLAKKGYKYVNVDEGWLKGRAPNGTIYEDLQKFPRGMRGLGEWVTSQSVAAGSAEKLVYGLYSCRGTCQCGTGLYHAVGSNGHEAADTQWMIDAGARWLKIDSCCGSQNHSVAFADYSKFRDAMNKSGEQVWFNLCGWRDWCASGHAQLRSGCFPLSGPGSAPLPPAHADRPLPPARRYAAPDPALRFGGGQTLGTASRGWSSQSDAA